MLEISRSTEVPGSPLGSERPHAILRDGASPDWYIKYTVSVGRPCTIVRVNNNNEVLL